MDMLELLNKIEKICEEYKSHDETDVEFNHFWYEIMELSIQAKKEILGSMNVICRNHGRCIYTKVHPESNYCSPMEICFK